MDEWKPLWKPAARPKKQPNPLRRKALKVKNSTRLHHARKRSERAHRADIIAENRARVFERDGWCRRCFRPGQPDDHCHEVASRAKLRGKRPEEIFTTQNCCRLCEVCHLRVVHENKEEIVYKDEARGCDGDIAFVPKTPKPVPGRES